MIDVEDKLVVIDIETTGFDYRREHILEIALIKLENFNIVDTYETLVNPQTRIRPSSIKIHGITDDMVTDAPLLRDILPDCLEFIGDFPLVAHNVMFDFKFLNCNTKRWLGRELINKQIDTLYMFKEVFPEEPSHSLDALASRFNVDCGQRHRAMADALVLAKLFKSLFTLYQERFEYKLQQAKNVEYLFERYLRLQSAIQVLQAELSDLKSIFKVYFENGGRPIHSSTGAMLTYDAKTVFYYDLVKLKPLVDALGYHEQAFKLNTSLIDRLILNSELPENDRLLLAEARTHSEQSKQVVVIKPDRTAGDFSEG